MKVSIMHTYRHKETGGRAVQYEMMDISQEFINDNCALVDYVPHYSIKTTNDEWDKVEMAITRNHKYVTFWTLKPEFRLLSKHFEEELFNV